MDEKFWKIIDETQGRWADILEEKQHFIKKKDVIKSILNETGGSFSGQFEATENIVEQIFQKWDNAEYKKRDDFFEVVVEDEISDVGEIKVITRFSTNNLFGSKNVSGKKLPNEDGKLLVELNVNLGSAPRYEIASTMAHEIMHCFQSRCLRQIKGITPKSLIIYHYLSQFIQHAQGVFAEYFFYGLYISYSIETAANVSSIANFMAEYFKGADKNAITTEQFKKALEKCDKFQAYKEVLRVLTTKEPNENDKEYIKQCMTRTFIDFFDDDKPIKFYEEEDFDVKRFINENRNNIIKTCRKTIDKMWKNITVFLNN